MQNTVKSTLPPRCSVIFARKFGRCFLGINAILEVYLPEDGFSKEMGYTFYWSGKPGEAKWVSGVGFAIKSELDYRLVELPPCVSDRIMILNLPLSNGRYSSLIIVYAPTLDFYDEDVGHFYSELRDTIRKVPRMTNLFSLVTLMPELKVTVTWRALGRREI